MIYKHKSGKIKQKLCRVTHHPQHASFANTTMMSSRWFVLWTFLTIPHISTLHSGYKCKYTTSSRWTPQISVMQITRHTNKQTNKHKSQLTYSSVTTNLSLLLCQTMLGHLLNLQSNLLHQFYVIFLEFHHFMSPFFCHLSQFAK